MSAYDLRITNGKLFRGNNLTEADICISEGKIRKIEKTSVNLNTDHTIDAKEMLVLPGLIDPHVHFRDPGFIHKEDFISGTKGAVAGGVTTVFDMPNTQPVITNVSSFREKARIVGEKAFSNFGLVAAASLDNIQDLQSLAAEGAIGFKTYMVAPSKDRAREYGSTFVTNSGQLYLVMREIKKTGLVHIIHAESDSLVSCLTEQMRLEGRKDPMAHYDSRPDFAEAEAVYDALLLSEEIGTKIHLAHISTGKAIQLLGRAKQRGVNVTAETCPHYLCFSKSILTERGPYAKYNPPARDEEDLESLFVALNNGTIDLLSTDHAPHSKEEKENGREDIFNAPSGTPGVETRLPLVLKWVHDGRLKLEDVPKMTSEAAARRFGLYPRKGFIDAGSDADLTIVDYNQEWRIKASDLQTKAQETVLYDGMLVRGRVKYTILNGETAYEQGVGFSKAGKGQLVKGSP